MPPSTHREAWTVPADHPAFAGHFPGQPILPGVAVLSQVIEAAGRLLGNAWRQEAVTLTSAKFLAALVPDDRCEVLLHVEAAAEPSAPATRLRFEVRRGDTVAASGILERAAAAAAVGPS